MVATNLKSALGAMPIDWLMAGEPFVRYRTLVDLVGKPEGDKEVEKAKTQIRRHSLIRQILARQNEDGYWGTARDIYKWWPKKDTTFWLLGVLADFGFTKEDKKMARACEYVFSTQLSCAGFGWAPPPTPAECFTGILTQSLANSGYASDSRVGRAHEWLMQRQRLDGGFWCKNTGQPGGLREKEPSCALATLCVLAALIQDAELKQSATVSKAAEFLLKCWDNRGRIKFAGHDSQIGTGWGKLQYPFTDYRILKYLDTLSQLEFARTDPRMSTMIDLLLEKRDEEGRFYAESVHKTWSGFDFGQKKSPSRWITLIAYRILKRMTEG
jgi:hypothetical protein